MVWKPRSDAHAIERVRVQFHFRDAIPKKGLRAAAEVVEANYTKWGFNNIESSSGANQIRIDAQSGALVTEKTSSSGVTVKRTDDGTLFEEFALLENVFGYVSTTYTSWVSFKGRLREIGDGPLDRALAATDVSILRLEYWDGFEFDGKYDEADAKLILRQPDSNIPEASIAGKSLWHSGIGWIEKLSGFEVLINRTTNTFDKLESNEAPRRQMGIYTLAEVRFGDASVSAAGAFEILDDLHKKSVYVFAESLNKEVRGYLGIALEKYE